MITIAEVTKRYGGLTALDRVSLTFDKGERVAFVGANGSGKTTLLRVLLGLVRFEGKVTVLGSDVAREPEVAMRSVAYVPQVAPPLDAPVAEVVRAQAALRGRSADETWARAKRLGLAADACRGKRFRDLSGGMKQKLLAAMALATAAPILVCDEPTANLDGDARASFFEQLDERPAHGVVVLCSHRIDEVRAIVGRVVEMSEGRVLRDAALDEIIGDLQMFRVEIALRAGADDAALVARGFARVGARRLRARVTHEKKIELVTAALRDAGDVIEDLSVVAEGEVAAGRRSSPRLVAVPS